MVCVLARFPFPGVPTSPVGCGFHFIHLFVSDSDPGHVGFLEAHGLSLMMCVCCNLPSPGIATATAVCSVSLLPPFFSFVTAMKLPANPRERRLQTYIRTIIGQENVTPPPAGVNLAVVAWATFCSFCGVAVLVS